MGLHGAEIPGVFQHVFSLGGTSTQWERAEGIRSQREDCVLESDVLSRFDIVNRDSCCCTTQRRQAASQPASSLSTG